MNKGKLYLIPSPLGEYDPSEVIPEGTLKVLKGISTFVVEETRTARRYRQQVSKGISQSLNSTS